MNGFLASQTTIEYISNLTLVTGSNLPLVSVT